MRKLSHAIHPQNKSRVWAADDRHLREHQKRGGGHRFYGPSRDFLYITYMSKRYSFLIFLIFAYLINLERIRKYTVQNFTEREKLKWKKRPDSLSTLCF